MSKPKTRRNAKIRREIARNAEKRRHELKTVKTFNEAFAGGFRERLEAQYGPIKTVLEYQGERLELKPVLSDDEREHAENLRKDLINFIPTIPSAK